MTSKNATLICLYKGKIHPLYDIEKKNITKLRIKWDKYIGTTE